MVKRYIAALMLIAMVLLVNMGTASAHHPEVSTQNVCISNTPTILVTTTAWDTDDPTHRVENEVSVTATNTATNVTVVVGSGAFNASNNYQFSLSFTGAPGSTYIIRSTAVRSWGVNENFGFAGEFRETQITQQQPCLIESPPVPPINTIRPPTTTVPTPSTTIGKLVETPTTIPPDDILLQKERITLPNTGVNYKPWLAIGFLCLCVGLAMALTALGTRKREQ